jgi:hypothetical protein
VTEAIKYGPQIITREHAEAVMLFYAETYWLRWLLVSGMASAGGGVPRVWFGLSVGGSPCEDESAFRRLVSFCPSVGIRAMCPACIYIRPIVQTNNQGGMK